MNGLYSDILTLPRPVSRRHPPMPPLKRAAQFAPFSALNGYEDAIDKTAQSAADSYEKRYGTDCEDSFMSEFP